MIACFHTVADGNLCGQWSCQVITNMQIFKQPFSRGVADMQIFEQPFRKGAANICGFFKQLFRKGGADVCRFFRPKPKLSLGVPQVDSTTKCL